MRHTEAAFVRLCSVREKVPLLVGVNKLTYGSFYGAAHLQGPYKMSKLKAMMTPTASRVANFSHQVRHLQCNNNWQVTLRLKSTFVLRRDARKHILARPRFRERSRKLSKHSNFDAD